MTRSFLRQPVGRLLLWAMLLVAIVPAVIMVYYLYQASWNNAWREINEKHRLLAMNLASPVKIYVHNHHDMLGQLAESIGIYVDKPAQLQTILEKSFKYTPGFETVAYLAGNDMVSAMVHRGGLVNHQPGMFSHDERLSKTRKTKKRWLSGIVQSVVSEHPVIIMTQPVFGRNDEFKGVLLAELSIELIEELRKNIHFGEQGHSAIVDKDGRVIAHPNSQWMETMHDLSGLSVVKKMMQGETGVIEFYSPFIKSNMVAGYTSVPELGWGIMVPQPKSEIEAQINQLMRSHLHWIALTGLLAIVIGSMLIRWITRPVNHLAEVVNQLSQNAFHGQFDSGSDNVPREIHALQNAFNKLMGRIKLAQLEISELNRSLQHCLAADQRRPGKKIHVNDQVIFNDYLTGLPNQRYLLQMMKNFCDELSCEFCLLLIDLDGLRKINQMCGHAMGDEIIRSLAMILVNRSHEDDVVARYEGDRFAILFRDDVENARHRAVSIQKTIKNYDFSHARQTVQITASLVLSCVDDKEQSIEKVIQRTMHALADAKQQGGDVLKIL